MVKPGNLDSLWEEVNAQCCKEANLNDMSDCWLDSVSDCWIDGAGCYCNEYGR